VAHEIRGVAAFGYFHPELLECPVPLRAREAHGEEDQVHLHLELGAGDRLEVKSAAVPDHLDPVGMELLDVAVLPRDARGRDRPLPDAAFFVGGGCSEDDGPLRPWVVGRALVGGTGEDLELVDRERALAVTIRCRLPLKSTS
jgi:hypothetical protein